MSRKTVERTSGFVATDADGRRYQVDVFTEFVEGVPARRTLTTRDGQHLNRLDKGRYEIAATKLELTSDDPTAP
jgi:hypothetical protein